MLKQLEETFTKYEIARILGARALQIAMDAPLLIKLSEKELEEMNFNPLEIAKRELVAGILPITVNRPMPKKREEKLKKLAKEQIDELRRKEIAEKEEAERKAEKEIEEETGKESPIHAAEIKSDKTLAIEEEEEGKKIAEDSEIMELSKPDDEAEPSAEESPAEEEI